MCSCMQGKAPLMLLIRRTKTDVNRNKEASGSVRLPADSEWSHAGSQRSGGPAQNAYSEVFADLVFRVHGNLL